MEKKLKPVQKKGIHYQTENHMEIWNYNLNQNFNWKRQNSLISDREIAEVEI